MIFVTTQGRYTATKKDVFVCIYNIIDKSRSDAFGSCMNQENLHIKEFSNYNKDCRLPTISMCMVSDKQYRFSCNAVLCR